MVINYFILKKKYWLIAVFSAVIFFTNAQNPTFQWVKQFGNSSHNYGTKMDVDASGNVYAATSFTGTIDADPGPSVLNFTSSGGGVNYSSLIVKLDVFGNLVWVKSIDGPSFGITAIKLDGLGNLYITGGFTWITDFDPSASTFTLAPHSLIGTNNDGYLLKLDLAGNFIWAKNVANGPYSEIVTGIDTDISGNIYLTGSFQGTADFDPSTANVTLTSISTPTTDYFDIFISKFDATGNLTWVKQIGGVGSDVPQDIAIDGLGNILITGGFDEIIDVDPGTPVFNLVPSSASNGIRSDTYIVKLNSSGNFVWAKQLTASSASGLSESYNIISDAVGNIFTTGWFTGTVDFDPSGGTYNISTVNFRNGYVLKLDASGNFVWAKSIGGPTFYGTRIASICLNGSNNLYTAGGFSGNNNDFDPGTGNVSLTSLGDQDGFILKLDTSGNFIWVKQLGGTGADFIQDIKVDASSNIYTTGIFNTTVDFNPDAPVFNLTSAGVTDMFVHKMSQCGSAPNSPSNVTTMSNQLICENNTTILTATSTGTVSWYSLPTAGSAIATGTMFVTPTLSAGTYTYYAEAFNCSVSANRTAITITVSATPTIGLASVSSNSICSGASVTITPNGASTYTLQPGNVTGTSFTVAPTSAIIYTINGTTASGCSSSPSTNSKITITVNATPTIGLGSISSNAICSGNTVTITPSGASTYTLVPGNVTGTSFTVAPLVNTTYTIRGTSSAGCLSNSSTNLIRTITIDVTPTITIVSVSNSSVCSGNSSVITPGGASTYTLLPGSTSGTSFTVNPLSTTVYTINGTSAGGCVNNPSTRATATIIVNTTPTIGLTSISNTTICDGSPVVIVPNGASTYTLVPGNVTGNSFTVTPSVTTSYTINGANSNGCVNNNGDGIFPVVTVSNLSITITSVTGVLCFGDANGSSSVSVSGGSPTYNYLWSNGAITSSISGVAAGSYTVTVTDALSCSSSKNIIISGPTASLSINSVSVTGVCSSKSNGGVTISVTGGTPNYSVLWNTGATGQVLSNVVSGAYIATITDGNNCTLTISEVIPSLSESDAVCVELFIPEIFSPNADGVNDKFEIKKVSAYPNNTLSIFNRWGSLVYKKQGYNNEWNGTSNVGDKTSKDYLPASTYYVVFDFGDGNTKQYTGFVQIQY